MISPHRDVRDTYGTQEGEISFCAYNTGVGWRQIIENMHKTQTSLNGTSRMSVTRVRRRS